MGYNPLKDYRSLDKRVIFEDLLDSCNNDNVDWWGHIEAPIQQESGRYHLAILIVVKPDK